MDISRLSANGREFFAICRAIDAVAQHPFVADLLPGEIYVPVQTFRGQLGWCRRWLLVGLFGVHEADIVDIQHMFVAVVESLREQNAIESAGIELPFAGIEVAALEFSDWQIDASPFFCRKLAKSCEEPGIGQRVAPFVEDAHQRRCFFRDVFIAIAPDGKRVPVEPDFRSDATGALQRHSPIAT